MALNLSRFVMPLVLGGAVSISMFACSSDKKTPTPTPSDDAGAGGGKGSGGKSSSGGKAASSSGGAAPVEAGNMYTCVPKTPGTLADGGAVDPGGAAKAGDGCCGEFGKCTATADLKDDPASSSYGHVECSATDKLQCAPKPAAELPDGGQTPSCHIAFGSLNLEGRCLPDCFTLNNPSASQLNEGDCPTLPGYRIICAPCYDPISGTKTGACERNSDAPVEPKKQFADCGSFPADAGVPGGLCVPKDLVAQTGADVKLVPQDTCADGELCAPKNKVVEQGSCFEHCLSPLAGDGVCVATYLVEATADGHGLSGTLGQVTCKAGETCAPCFSPLSNASTGACSQ